jgi:hypothetical protein
MEVPLRLFCCYARLDQPFLYGLKKHLMPLQREGLIDIISDIDVDPGMEWERTIHHYLEQAQIILLLVSPDFIASNYCYDIEMDKALTRHQQGIACVIPVIIRPVVWQGTPLRILQALPKDAKPISSWQNSDEAYTNVTAGIRTIVRKSLFDNRVGTIPPTANTYAQKQPVAPHHNLPQPDYVAFVGRQKELDWVIQRLSAERTWQMVITGIGGVGKSTLALAIAHYYREHYNALASENRFEAIIWTSAKEEVLTVMGRKQSALAGLISRTLEDIYTTIAQTLKREDITRAISLEEQNRLVQKALSSQRTLLIVDNIESIDDERVKTFLRNLPVSTKSLSENANFSKKELSASKMKKREIILGLFFPANQQAAGAVEPGMGAFHDPSPRAKTRSGRFFLLLLSTTANVKLVVTSLSLLTADGIVVASIQTQMLWMLWSGIRANHHHAIQSDAEQFHIMAIRPLDDYGQGNPIPISQQTAFDSQLATIGGIGSGRGVAERGFGHRSIHGLPFPLNPDQFIIGRETRLPERLEEARSFPFLKAIMNGRGRAQFSWQGIPLTSGTQQIHHRLKRLAIWHAWTPPFGVRGGERDQGFYLFPQRVADFPRMGSCHDGFLSLVSFSLPESFRISSKYNQLIF